MVAAINAGAGGIELIALDLLGNNATQTRAGLRNAAIEEYAQRLRDELPLDPALVFRDGEDLYLASGFHRREAYRLAGKREMPCVVRAGTIWEAIQAGIQDNEKHVGERLTRADKQHNVRLILECGPRMSDHQIAKLAQVCHVTVGKFRKEMESTGRIEQPDKRVGQDGRERRIPTTNAPNTDRASESQPLPTQDQHSPVPDKATTAVKVDAVNEVSVKDVDGCPVTPDDFKNAQKSLAKVGGLVDRSRNLDRQWYYPTRRLYEQLSHALETLEKRLFANADGAPF